MPQESIHTLVYQIPSFSAVRIRHNLTFPRQVSGGHLLNAAGKHSHLSVPNPSFSAARTKAEIMPRARPGMGQFLLWRYFAERSTALRSME